MAVTFPPSDHSRGDGIRSAAARGISTRKAAPAVSHFSVLARDHAARRGTLQMEHGTVETPAFMPVGTAGTVKALTPSDLREIGTQIVLGNAYHLWLRPGADVIVRAGGLHAFMAWDGPILMDSGGFQVFSLEALRKIDDDGVTFASHLDGTTHRFTPESITAFEEALGVDVGMVLDVCVKLPATTAELASAVDLTTRWAEKARAARQRPQTALFGIQQGGLDEHLRRRSAAQLVALDFDGYAIGGLSVGETRAQMYETARLSAGLLPEEKPRYLMGVGTVADVVVAVDCGIDLFDCVYPTRCGRNGRALSRSGELNIRNAEYRYDYAPLDRACSCSVCKTFSRAYLSHLSRANEMLGGRLLSYHNVAVLNTLLEEARGAINDGRWEKFREETLAGTKLSR
ncbi:MAG: tRNA guanosine(34) transglycosylase Tgt [Candidatus Eremiobacteraeota bacterium]|nr:tRNA guanosine(34) transglycosylase Tgt [Candidatus Eremiobacteraeota bacterium]